MKFQHIIEAVYYKPWNIMDAGWYDINRIVKPHVLGAALPANVEKFIAARMDRRAFRAASSTLVKCPECGTEFDSAMQPETAMGAVDCPHCGQPVIPEDSAVAKMLADSGEDSPDTDFFGEPIERFQVTPDGLAIIPVFGPLINHASLMDRMCGACSYQQIQNDLQAALGAKNLQRIILKIGSPGGMCNGMAETCRKIMQVREMGIPIKAICDTVCGSAAYGLAASCDSIEITETAMIGCVGSMIAILDSSKAMELVGLSQTVIKSGDYKGAGMDGTALTKEQRAEFQARVAVYGEQFREIVRSNRMIEEDLLQGQTFIGQDAIDKGFADRLIEDMGDGCAPDEESDDGLFE